MQYTYLTIEFNKIIFLKLVTNYLLLTSFFLPAGTLIFLNNLYTFTLLEIYSQQRITFYN